jgi:hypothetical protein
MEPKMMKPLSLAFLVALASPAVAQQANVVTACGSMAPFGALTPGGQSFPTIDINGRLCLSSPSLTAVVDAMSDKINALEARLKILEARK